MYELGVLKNDARDERFVEWADRHRAVFALCVADHKVKDAVTLALGGVSGVLD